MTDREILERRDELNKRFNRICEEWDAYDKRHPVIVGACRPADYDRQQLRFVESLQEIRAEIALLPATKADTVKRLVLAAVIVAGAIVGLLWKLVSH